MKKTIDSVLVGIDRLYWLWLGLAAPLMFFPNPKRSLALLVVPGIWLLHWIVVRRQPSLRDSSLPPRVSRSPISITPLNGVLLLMSLMVLVSTWATYDIPFSLPYISGMVLGLGIFFAVVRAGERPEGWWLAFLIFLAAGVGIAVMGLLGTRWFGTKISILNPITAKIPFLISGLPGDESGFHPNIVGGALLWVLPVLITLSVLHILPQNWRFSSKRPSEPGKTNSLTHTAPWDHWKGWQVWGLRIILWLATGFVGVVVVLSQSRNSYISLAVTCLVMFVIALPPVGRWTFSGVLVVAVILAVILVSKEDLAQAQDWVIGSDIVSQNAFSLNTLEGRLELWSRAIYGLQDFPFTGMGMNTFREVVHVLYPLFLVAPDTNIGHAHNEFFQAGLDLGIPGLIALMGIYLVAFAVLIRMWRRSFEIALDVRLSRAIVLGLGGGLLGHLIYGLVDAVALGSKPGILFWMLVGLIVGLNSVIEQSRV